MTNQTPNITQSKGLSIIWLIPIVTALVGGWLIIKTLSDKGPEATITFKTAAGLEIEKTKVKYKSIDIGIVKHVQFSEDLSNVVVHIEFEKDTEHFLRRDTKFWVVKPRLGLRGVSGLDTLVSGAYIEIEPGPGALQTSFIGLEKPPIVKADAVGKKITLSTDTLGSIGIGSPIYYQGLEAGEVLGYELSSDEKTIFIHTFVKAPFDKMIKANSRFWNVSGIDMKVGADGFSVKTASMQSLIFGGIAFETPETLEPASDDVNNLIFTLYPNYENIQENAYTQKIKFITFFNSSVRGLNIGAPVEFKGIKIGKVIDVRLQFDPDDTSFKIPVLLEIEPERIIEKQSGQELNAQNNSLSTIKLLIERGLRASLQTGSLLTGQLYIDLDMHPDTAITLSGEKTPFLELPTVPTALEAIKKSVNDLLAKVNNLPLQEMADSLLQILNSTNNLIQSDQIPNVMENAAQSLDAFRSILQQVDAGNINETIQRGNDVLKNLAPVLETSNETLQSLNQTLDPDSAMQNNLSNMTDELHDTARAIRSFIEMLERNPQSFIFGKEQKGE